VESATRRHHSQPKNVVSNMAISIMTRRRILFIATVPPPITGQAVACEALYADLVRQGHDVTLINLSKQSFRQGVNSMWRLLEIARILGKVLRYGRRAELVYLTPAQSVAGNLRDLAILLCLGPRIRRTYLHMHGGAGMREILSDRHPWLLRINAWLLRKVAGVIVLGERLISIYSQIVPIERIHAVKNFAADECFIDDQALALKWAEAENFNVLFLSNHLPGKGYRELNEAIRSMPPAQRAHFSFHFAGGFEDRSSESEFLDRIATLDGVTYHGIVSGESKRRLLHAAQLFCLPTYYPYEGQPISILEAYASGCAVITTDHSGIFDIFTPEVNGWEVQPKSAQSIANVLARALSESNSIAEMGRLNALLSSVEYRRTRNLEKLNRCLGLNAPVDVIPDT
jgi:glycosyltransferase involved in cell wall biosynthesis